MRLEMIRIDESCLAIVDHLQNKLILLHSWSYWTKEEDYSCSEPPQEEVFENKFLLKDEKNQTKHTDLGRVVMGDLSNPGERL